MWIRPPWPSDGYLWLDFPEAIFTDQGLLFLSHYSARFPVIFREMPGIAWRTVSSGVTVTRSLPNGVSFTARAWAKDRTRVQLEIRLVNGSRRPLTGIKLQTCAYLRACKEFADYSQKNKFVHTPGNGWQTMYEALLTEKPRGKYRIGWRQGRKLIDLPVIVTLSHQGQRLAAMTWFKDTYAVTGNPEHPCMHADPFFRDLKPGAAATVRGELIFFKGSLAQFEKYFRASCR